MTNKRLIITAGAKGGSGKSLASTILHSWLVAQGSKTITIDGDSENSTLLRFIPSSRFIDMRQTTAIDDILSPIVAGEADTVLLDSRAATSEEMVQWFKQIGVEAIRTELKTSVNRSIIPVRNGLSNSKPPQYIGCDWNKPHPFTMWKSRNQNLSPQQ